MPRTLLLSSPDYSWREWLKEHRGTHDRLCLDPADPSQTPPGKVTTWRGGKPIAWRFYGSLDANRAPHVLVAALAQMLAATDDDAIVQLFAMRNSPLMRQVATICAQLVRPSQILAPRGAALDLEGYPVGPEEVEVEAAFPLMVQQAQRKAQWMKLLEDCSEHTVDLKRVAIEGSRLGAGKRIHPDDLSKAGLTSALHGEISGGNLLVVAEEEVEDHAMARALDHFHATRATVVKPDAYDHLLSSFAREDGEDFGFGLVQCVDWTRGIAKILSTAVPPAPVRILRLGGMRVDPSGRELGEVRPWQV